MGTNFIRAVPKIERTVNEALIYVNPKDQYIITNWKFCGLPNGKPRVVGHHRWPHQLISLPMILTWLYFFISGYTIFFGNADNFFFFI
jgi:hypothetical protein